jgi:phospholipase/carboxylesterase
MSGEGQAMAGLLAALLPALDALGHAARHAAPGTLAALAAAVAPQAAALEAARAAFAAHSWPERLLPVRDCLDASAALARDALAALGAAAEAPHPMRAAFAALRALPRAEDALYPLAAFLPAVSRHFLDGAERMDEGLIARLAAAPPGREARGVMHLGGPPGTRGGASLYVPETLDGTEAAPLAVALHGGGGTGAHFLWSLLRAARARGVVLLAPTSRGRTWDLHAPEADLAAIADALAVADGIHPLAADRRLLLGMSDGGTFATIAALRGAPGFTHVAPVAASFSPLMIALAEPGALRALPVRLTHGARDWMFPVETAREAAAALRAAGAAMSWREIPDLAHAWPREEAGAILDWFLATPPRAA